MASTPAEEAYATSSKYERFTITDTDYKTVNGTAIKASVLVPKGIQAGSHPIIVRWHGGGLITGARLFPDWFGAWILDLAYSRHAIIVIPDYRLLPEARGIDQLQDCADFYTWLFTTSSLASIVPANVSPVLEHILVTGESAGGWFALQSGFLPAALSKHIGAIVAQYPMIDLRSAHFTTDYEKILFLPPPPQLPRSLVDTHVARLHGDEIVTSREPFDPLLIAMAQRGMFPPFLGQERQLYPLEALEDAKTFPPVWIAHGTDDRLVPVGGTEKFAEAMKRSLPDVPLRVTLAEGEEHGFDGHDAQSGAPATLETEWVKAGLEFIIPFWEGR